MFSAGAARCCPRFPGGKLGNRKPCAPIECRASFLKALVFQQASQSLSLLLFQVLPDELPAIFLGGHAATYVGELLLGEGHLPAAALAPYLDEARFRARCYLAGKGFTVTHCSITKGPGKGWAGPVLGICENGRARTTVGYSKIGTQHKDSSFYP